MRPHFSRFAWWLIASGSVGFWLSGCVAPPPAQAGGVASANIVIANDSDYAWRVTVRDSLGREIAQTRLAPRESREWEVPGGESSLEQARLGPGDEPVDVRKLPMRFEAGQRYEWRLTTLHSVAGETPP